MPGIARTYLWLACAGVTAGACSRHDPLPEAAAPLPHNAAKPVLGAELRGWFPERPAATSNDAVERRTYRLELEASLQPRAELGEPGRAAATASEPDPGASGRVPEEAARGSRFALSGVWSITPAGNDGDTQLVLAELQAETLELTAPASRLISADDYRDRIRTQLGSPVLLKLDARGRVMALKADPRILTSAFGMLRSVIAAAQVTRGAAWDREWSAEEHDSGGRYRAQYERTGERSFRKQKVVYLAPAPGTDPKAPASEPAQIVSSAGELVTSRDGALESSTIRDELTIEPGSGLPPLHSIATYRFRRLGDEPVAPSRARLAALEDFEWRALDRPPPPEAGELDLDLSKVSRYTRIAEILTELDRLDVAGRQGDGDRQTRLQIALGSLFRLSDAALTEAKRVLAQHSRHSDVVLRALASAGTPGAQALALDRIEHPEKSSGVTRGELLVALSMTRHPSLALVDGLERLAKDPVLQGQAILGLGSAAFRLQRENPPLARRILHLLQRNLEAAHTQGSFKAAALALRAFGNAGHPEMIGMLEPYLDAAQAPVRAAALRALRRVASPEVDQLLSSHATNDSDSDVRAVARNTLENRVGEHLQPGS